MIEKLTSFFQNKTNLVVVVLAGILLMVIALPVKKEEDGQNGADGAKEEAAVILSGSEEDYARAMERRLEETLSRLEGAGEVKVMITLSDSEETVLEKDVTRSLSETGEEDGEGGKRDIKTEDTAENTVFLSESGQSFPYVVKTLPPKVEGVIVLAEGAGEGNVSMELLDAVRVIFGIEANRVKVMKLQGGN